jgi:hypothetical protein
MIAVAIANPAITAAAIISGAYFGGTSSPLQIRRISRPGPGVSICTHISARRRLISGLAVRAAVSPAEASQRGRLVAGMPRKLELSTKVERPSGSMRICESRLAIRDLKLARPKAHLISRTTYLSQDFAALNQALIRRICRKAKQNCRISYLLESKMTSYRTILVAAAVVLGSTSAYASGGFKDIPLRDEGLNIHHSVPRTNLLESRTSQQGELAPYASVRRPVLEGRSSVSGPAPSAYEEGSTWSRVPVSIRDQDIATRGNDNK